MLELLFSSSIRVECLQVFLDHPEKAWTVPLLAKKINVHKRRCAAELKKLLDLEILLKRERSLDGKKNEWAYQLNTNFLLYPELRALFLKARLLIEKELISGIERIGSIQYLVLTGIFVGAENTATDVLIVGRVNRQQLKRLIHRFERALNHEINYTILSRAEFKYRRDITDLFLFSILEDTRKIVVVDRLLNIV